MKNRRLSQPAWSGREAPLPGLLMDPMQNCRLCSVRAPVPASAERLGPGEERCSPRSGWLAGALAPTPGFMGLPLSGSVLREIDRPAYLLGVGPPEESDQLSGQPLAGEAAGDLQPSLLARIPPLCCPADRQPLSQDRKAPTCLVPEQ